MVKKPWLSSRYADVALAVVILASIVFIVSRFSKNSGSDVSPEIADIPQVSTALPVQILNSSVDLSLQDSPSHRQRVDRTSELLSIKPLSQDTHRKIGRSVQQTTGCKGRSPEKIVWFISKTATELVKNGSYNFRYYFPASDFCYAVGDVVGITLQTAEPDDEAYSILGFARIVGISQFSADTLDSGFFNEIGISEASFIRLFFPKVSTDQESILLLYQLEKQAPDWFDSELAPPGFPRTKLISTQIAEQLANSGEATVVDVRSKAEFEADGLRNSVNIPLGKPESSISVFKKGLRNRDLAPLRESSVKFLELDRNRPIAIIAQSPRDARAVWGLKFISEISPKTEKFWVYDGISSRK